MLYRTLKTVLDFIRNLPPEGRSIGVPTEKSVQQGDFYGCSIFLRRQRKNIEHPKKSPSRTREQSDQCSVLKPNEVLTLCITSVT